MDQQAGAGSRDGSDTTTPPPGEQDYIRHQVAKNIKKTLPTTKSYLNTQQHKKKKIQNHETNRKKLN